MRLNDIGRIKHSSLILFICGKFLFLWLMGGLVTVGYPHRDSLEIYYYLFLFGILVGVIIWLAFVIYLLVMPSKPDANSEVTPITQVGTGHSE